MNTARTDTLCWRTRDTTRTLANALMVALAITLVSGLLLWLPQRHDNLAQVLLLTHLCAGVVALILTLPFVILHWRDGREPLRHLCWPLPLVRAARVDAIAGKRLLGLGLLWSLAIVLLSGLGISLPALAYLGGRPLTWPYGLAQSLLDSHRLLTLPLLLALFWHLPRENKS